ncbi:unnamed protein product [Rhizophagus irregularis]|nr:unnamed protein product [Rhizophagus irregularis]
MDFRKSILRFVSSGGLPKNGKPKDSFGRASEERKPKDSQSDGLPYSEERENSKIRSGGLLKKEKPRNQDSIWWASEERKTKKPRNVRSGGLPKNENLKIRSGGLPKNENPKIHSGRLLKNENPKIKIRSGGLLCGKTKIQEPRFDRDRVEWASDLWEKKNQDSSRVSQVSSEEQKKPKIRKFGWIAKEQSKIRIYEYMNHVIVELYLN